MDNKNNQLNDVTIKSIFNYTMDCNQTVNEMLRKLVNGENIIFNTSINVDEDDEVVVNTKKNHVEDDYSLKLKATQQKIFNRICLEEIHYYMHKDNEVPLDKYGHPLKWVSLIYNNVDNFINLLKTKIGSLKNNQYCLHLHENFLSIENSYDNDETSSLRLYYCLQYLKDTPSVKDDTNNCDEEFNKTKTKLDCLDIITKNIKIYFADKDVTTQLQLNNKYNGMLRVHNDGSTNISQILNEIKEESKK